MRMLSIVAIGFFLMSERQLCAQTADPFGSGDAPFVAQDPFGPTDNAARHADRKRKRSPKAAVPNENAKQVASEPAGLYPYVSADRHVASSQRIGRALNGETTFDYLDQPLKDVVEDISYVNNIPIVIDTRAFEDFGIDTGTPITISLKGISLRSALRLAFRDLDLTYVIRDEVLQITTTEAAESATSTRFYHVAELLPPNRDGEVLVELIKTLVAPDSWGGSAHVRSIVYVEHLESLAIRHTDEVFYEIEGLLATTKRIIEDQRLKGQTLERDPFD